MYIEYWLLMMPSIINVRHRFFLINIYILNIANTLLPWDLYCFIQVYYKTEWLGAGPNMSYFRVLSIVDILSNFKRPRKRCFIHFYKRILLSDDEKSFSEMQSDKMMIWVECRVGEVLKCLTCGLNSLHINFFLLFYFMNHAYLKN